jgi:hypothetical protein
VVAVAISQGLATRLVVRERSRADMPGRDL